ncbi:hypothetical protein ACQV8J_25350, partial [Klebsiella pneumoniae]
GGGGGGGGGGGWVGGRGDMPLNYLVDQLKEDVGEVIFLGIQPDIVGFYYPMTQPVKEAVARVYQQLAGWQGKGGFTQLEAADD